MEKEQTDTEPRSEITHPELRDELLAMRKIDQEKRDKLMEDLSNSQEVADELAKIDEMNTRRLLEIVDEVGWPKISEVGADGSHASWILVQHADLDIDFQERCLELMKNLIADHEVSKPDVASLTDRVLLNKGEEQLFGTQFQNKDSGRWFGPRPIADMEHLEERRKEYDLEPFAEYEAYMRSKYGGEGKQNNAKGK